MNAEEIKTTFHGMEGTKALRAYVVEKVGRAERLLARATHVSVVLTDKSTHRGVDQDFKLDIDVGLPKKNIHVAEVGKDMYAAIDTGTDTLDRQFRKYEETI